MNVSPITGQAEYDYRFISYLLNEIFSNETLVRSAVYQSNTSRNRKFDTLDQEKFSFIRNVYGERTKNDKNRFQNLSTHINKKCTFLRNATKNKR